MTLYIMEFEIVLMVWLSSLRLSRGSLLPRKKEEKEKGTNIFGSPR